MKDNLIKDHAFTIKIADLLHEAWREDQLIFSHKFSDQLPNLTDLGMSGTFTVQSLDKNSLLWTLSDVTAQFHDTCESCGAAYKRSVSIPSYVARFVFEDDIKKINEENQTDEVLFLIDPKVEVINIEDMVVQSILLNEPFVKRCDACTQRLADTADDEDDLWTFESTGNITFS